MPTVMEAPETLDRPSAAEASATPTDSDGLSVTTESCGTHTLVRVAGALDAAQASELDEALRAAERDAAALVLDLRRVDLSSPSAIGVLLAFEARARQAGFGAAILRPPVAGRRAPAIELVGRVCGGVLTHAVAGVIARPAAAAA